MSELPIPRKVFNQHIVALGKTGSGKSSAIRGMVEDLLERNEPVCIVDPKGDWYGLKSSSDGKHPGFPVVIFGGEHGDVPLNSRSGGAVAELAATGNRPCIIDLGGWMPGARTEFWIDFASSFFRMSRGRRWLVIDEVHNFCPKGKIMDVNAGKMLHWSNRLASEGRGKGINLIAASQRPQKVHNDFLTSCETLVAMRVIHPSDREAIKLWLEGAGDKEKATEVLNTLAQMKRGEAWVWSPEIEFGPKRVTFPMFQTYDSFKPQNSTGPVKLKGWADVDLAEVTKKLEAAVKEAEAKDPAKLQAKVRELQAELAKAVNKKLPTVKNSLTLDPKAIDRAIRPLKLLIGDAMKILVKVNAIGFDAPIKAEEVGRIVERAISLAVRQAQDGLERRSREFDALKREVNSMLNKAKHVLDQDIAVTVDVQKQEPFKISQEPQRQRLVPHGTSNGDLPQGEKEILIALARYDQGVERNTLTVLTGYKRSTRDAYLARLKTKGFWEEKGSRIVATQEGVNALGGDYKPQPATGAELQQYWVAELPEGEKKILQCLIAALGRPVGRETLSEATGFQRSTRDAYLSRLAAKQLVEAVGRGEVKASETLFA